MRCRRDTALQGLQTGWVASGVPAPGGTSWAAACQRLFFGRTLIRQLLSHQLANSRGLSGIRGQGGRAMASYLAPRVLQLHPGCTWLFCRWEKPPGTGFILAGLQVGCFPCQMPGSRIWGGPGLLCAASYLRSPAPVAQAGDGGLAHAEWDGTWEGTGCFGGDLKPRRLVWVSGRYKLTCAGGGRGVAPEEG